MINKVIVISQVQNKTLSSIICDACKKEVPAINIGEIQEFVHIRHTFGYAGYSDGDRMECDLCKDCSVKILPFRLIEEGSEEF
jgi:hypothetical protein